MPDSDNIKKKRAAKQPHPTQTEESFEDYDLIEDEIPVKRKSKKKKSQSKSPERRGARRKSAEREEHKNRGFRDKKNNYRSFNLIDVLFLNPEQSGVKPIRIFGFTIKRWPLIIVILILIFIGYVIISNGALKPVQQTVTVVGLADDLEGYNIVVLSDLNGKRFGDEQSSLIRQINALKYDMLICVGDMVGEDGDAEPFYELLDGISRPERVFFSCGDADPGPFVENARDIDGTLSQIVLEDWILGAIERGANYVDAPLSIQVGNATLWLTPSSFMNVEASQLRDSWKDQTEQEEQGTVSGLSSDYATLPFTSYRYQIAKRFYNAVGTMHSNDLVIALAHSIPDDDFIVASSTHNSTTEKYMPAPELIVSGHYCGGVWHLPFVGAFYVPNDNLPRNGWFPDAGSVAGLSQVGETQTFITKGLSTTSAIKLMPFRFLNDPEISVLTLTAKLPDNILEVE